MLVIKKKDHNFERLWQELKKGNRLCIAYEEKEKNCIYLKDNALVSLYVCAIALPAEKSNLQKILSMYYCDVEEFYIYGNNTNTNAMILEIIQ